MEGFGHSRKKLSSASTCDDCNRGECSRHWAIARHGNCNCNAWPRWSLDSKLLSSTSFNIKISIYWRSATAAWDATFWWRWLSGGDWRKFFHLSHPSTFHPFFLIFSKSTWQFLTFINYILMTFLSIFCVFISSSSSRDGESGGRDGEELTRHSIKCIEAAVERWDDGEGGCNTFRKFLCQIMIYCRTKLAF